MSDDESPQERADGSAPPHTPTCATEPLSASGGQLCLRRLSHPDVSRYETLTTWCTRPDGHAGDCAGPEPTILVPNRFGPADSQRRRW